MARHWTFLQGQIASKYRRKVNPLVPTRGVVEKGGKLYHKHCATCRATDGMRDLKGVNDLSPSPGLLTYMLQTPTSFVVYLLWVISEGGQRFNTDMLAFTDRLSERELWTIIIFVHAGFPALARN
jgi:mono/diheme cytochrome c family protein